MVFDYVMLCLRSIPSISASPDGIVMTTAEIFEDLEWERPGSLEVDGIKYPWL